MNLRGDDHQATHRFLAFLESKARGEAAPGVRFPGFGGGGYGAAAGNTSFPWLSRMQPGAAYDYEAEAGDTWRNAALAICLGWIKRNLPEPRVAVWKDKAEVPGHPGARLFVKVNPFYSGDVLLSGAAVSWVCKGNVYLLKGQNLAGQTGQLYYVPHWQVAPRWPADGSQFISHYDYTVDGRTVRLRPDQVVHLRNGVNPLNTREGMSEVDSILREICTDNEAAGFTASTLRNMGVPGFVMSPEQEQATLEKDEREEIKDRWREDFTGENRGGIMVASVRLKMDKISLTPEELTLDKIREIPEARICGATGVNGQVVGLTCGARTKTYSNYAEARRAAYEDCLVPMLKQFGRQVTDQCPELFRPGETLGWDFTDVSGMQEDANQRAKRAVVLFQGQLVTKDEGRAVVSLPPSSAGDGDTYFVGQALHGATPAVGGNTVQGE